MSRHVEPPQEEQSPNLRGFDDFDLLLGDIMRGERATKGKSLLDVQRELKIRASYIAAIENTDPSAFETPGFIAGYVRSYARYLGLDPEWAFKTFCEEGNYQVQHSTAAEGSLKRSPKPEKSKVAPGAKNPKAAGKPAHLRDPFTEPSVSYLPKGEAMFAGVEPKAVGSVFVLCVLLGGIVFGGWTVLQEVQKVQFTPIEQTPSVVSQLDPLAPPTPEGSGEDAPEVAGLSAPPSAESFSRLYRPEALDIPVLVARDGPIAGIDPDTIGTFAPERDERPITARTARAGAGSFGEDGTSDVVDVASSGLLGPDAESGFANLDIDNLLPSPQVVAATSPSVSLLAVRPSWVRVRASDGTVIFEKILDAGEQFDVPLTEEPATLRAGNAGSLYFAVNGETYGPAGDGPAVVKNVVLSPDALQTDYAVAQIDADADLARFVAVAEAATTGEDQ